MHICIKTTITTTTSATIITYLKLRMSVLRRRRKKLKMMFLNFMKQKKNNKHNLETQIFLMFVYFVWCCRRRRALNIKAAFVGSSVSIFLLLFCAKRASQHAYLMQVVAQLIFYHTLAFRACFLFVLCPRSVRVCVMVFVEFAVAATVTATNHVITNTNKQLYILFRNFHSKQVLATNSLPASLSYSFLMFTLNILKLCCGIKFSLVCIAAGLVWGWVWVWVWGCWLDGNPSITTFPLFGWKD